MYVSDCTKKHMEKCQQVSAAMFYSNLDSLYLPVQAAENQTKYTNSFSLSDSGLVLRMLGGA